MQLEERLRAHYSVVLEHMEAQLKMALRLQVYSGDCVYCVNCGIYRHPCTAAELDIIIVLHC
jgi:hypothetical protein